MPPRPVPPPASAPWRPLTSLSVIASPTVPRLELISLTRTTDRPSVSLPAKYLSSRRDGRTQPQGVHTATN